MNAGRYLERPTNGKDRVKYRGSDTFDELLSANARSAIMMATVNTCTKRSIKDPMGHLMLNCAPEDRELSFDEWQDIYRKTIGHMKLDGFMSDWWVHDDRDHKHMHIRFIKVKEDGTQWRIPSRNNSKNLGAGDYKWKSRMDELCRDLERDYGLRELDTPLTAHREGRTWDKARSLTRAEQEINARTGREQDLPMNKDQVSAIADQAKGIFLGSKSWEELSERLSSEMAYTLKPKGRGLIIRSNETGHYAKVSQLAKIRMGADKAERISKDRLSRFYGESWDDFWARSKGQVNKQRSLKADTSLQSTVLDATTADAAASAASRKPVTQTTSDGQGRGERAPLSPQKLTPKPIHYAGLEEEHYQPSIEVLPLEEFAADCRQRCKTDPISVPILTHPVSPVAWREGRHADWGRRDGYSCFVASGFKHS
ncbi:MAG: relaxase/mobilization nuclease domain-containing protein [Pseudomonadota bacterium]